MKSIKVRDFEAGKVLREQFLKQDGQAQYYEKQANAQKMTAMRELENAILKSVTDYLE